MFFILMAVMYTPGCAVMLICYIPYKSLQTLAILLNPNNYITGGGNPFKSDSKISSMDNNNFSTMDHGGGKADQGKRVLSKVSELVECLFFSFYPTHILNSNLVLGRQLHKQR